MATDADDVDPVYDALLRARPGDYGSGPEEIVAKLLARPPWHREAACGGQGPAIFFVARGESTKPAKAICAVCTVTAQCEAASADEQGIWAGTTARSRRTATRSEAA